jgi:hypothetical protein
LQQSFILIVIERIPASQVTISFPVVYTGHAKMKGSGFDVNHDLGVSNTKVSRGKTSCKLSCH